MSYITLEEYKALVGKSDLTPTQEAQVEAILWQSKQMIDDVLWDLTVANRTEIVNYTNVFLNGGITKIYTYKLWISEVVSINGVPYTEDFKIDGSRWHIIYLKGEYILDDYPFLEIELTNGYDPIPSDIKFLQALLTLDIVNQMNWWEITKKAIGDKELTFSTNTTENRQNFIQSIFNSYKIVSV